MPGHNLEPSRLFKIDYLVLKLDKFLVEDRAKSTIHRVKEIVSAPGPNAYPLRDVKTALRERPTNNVVDNDILKEFKVDMDVEAPTMEEIEDMERPLAVEDEMIVERIALQRIPRASRIYVPRVGPPPRPPVPDEPLDHSVGIEFKIDNQKNPASRSYDLYVRPLQDGQDGW